MNKNINYLKQTSHQLEHFRETPSLFRFRCPFCKGTRRCGVVYKNDGLFYCHICKKQGFGDLLELVNKNVFNEYMKEKYPQTKSNKKELLMEQERILALHQIEHQKRVSEFRKHLQKLNLSLKDKFLV